jgi:hypothetical protein
METAFQVMLEVLSVVSVRNGKGRCELMVEWFTIAPGMLWTLECLLSKRQRKDASSKIRFG